MSQHLPDHPDLDQLRQQAEDLLPRIRLERPGAQLAEAQLALANDYGVASWPRLLLAGQMVAAIWRDDAPAVHELVTRHPQLLHEPATGKPGCNWGPPLSYAANLSRDGLIDLLHGLGATDLESAMNRAILQGNVETAQHLYAMGARPLRGAIMGPAENLSPRGMRYLIGLGEEICDHLGDRLAPVGMVLGTYTRWPQGKHECLELLAAEGIELPDTPAMAVHRGRLDLLETHLQRDPLLPGRQLSSEEIIPRQFGGIGIHGMPLEGATLLHLCVDYNEPELLAWLLDRGADADAPAAIDARGFGGHTALFGCVVTAPGTAHDDELARLLLDQGANPNARASLRKDDREFRDVTPLSWGEQYGEGSNQAAMQLIAERGGRP